MFEFFSEKAIRVIMLAQEESRNLGHNYVGTEQILLGLIAEGSGIASKVLESMGINLKSAKKAVENIIGRGSGFIAVEIPFTPSAKRILNSALIEAKQYGKKFVDTEYILLSILKDGEGVAIKVLENLGTDIDKCQQLIIERIENKNKINNVEYEPKENGIATSQELINSAEILTQLNNELQEIIAKKEDAIRNMDFDKATEYRDEETIIKNKIKELEKGIETSNIMALPQEKNVTTKREFKNTNYNARPDRKIKEINKNDDNINNLDRSFEAKFKRLKEAFLDLFRL